MLGSLRVVAASKCLNHGLRAKALARCGSVRAASSSAAEFMSQDVNDVAALMRASGSRRAYALMDPESGKIKASAPHMQPLADFMNEDRVDMLQVRRVMTEQVACRADCS